MKDVFISYKAEDIEEAGWVKSVLEGNGISCWMAPSCIPGGSSYAVEIPHAIRESKVFVLVLSSKAQSSQWVSREIDLALNEGKVVLPFMLENCALKDDFNFYLTNVQRYAAYENKVAAMEKMIKEIKALVGEGSGEAPIDSRETVINSKVEPEKPKVDKKAKEKTKGKYDMLCIWSLIFGVLSMVALFGLLIVPNLIAILLALKGVENVTKNNKEGEGFAVFGLVLGLIGNLVGFTTFFSFGGSVIAIAVDIVAIVMFVKKYKKLKKR